MSEPPSTAAALDVPGGIVDTHCHLFLMERPVDDVVADAVAGGISQLVSAAIDPDTTRTCIEHAERHGAVFASAGMHPHTASALDDAAKSAIERLAGHERVVAIGETGLDYFRMHSPREDQLASFRWQIALSNETGLPLIVHVRDAWPDALRVLAEERARHVVIHCFSGGPQEARECGARAYTMSFAANVTYPKNAELREAATAAPADAIVVETDSPFLPPDGLRGRENVPQNAWVVARAVADARGEPPADVAARAAAVARRVFTLPTAC